MFSRVGSKDLDQYYVFGNNWKSNLVIIEITQSLDWKYLTKIIKNVSLMIRFIMVQTREELQNFFHWCYTNVI